MATGGTGVGLGGVERFDSLSQQIEETFIQYHSLLNTQKVKLLEEVGRVKKLYLTHRDMEKSIQQMEGVIQATNEMVTENLVAENKEQVVGLWSEKIRELRRNKNKLEAVSDLKFLPNTEEFTESVSRIHLRDCLCEEYSKRREPLVTKGRRGAGEEEFGEVHAIAVDREMELVYVTDYLKDMVCVYSTDGDSVRKFGEMLSYPHGICLSNEFVFVSNGGTSCIVKLSKAGEYLSKSNDYKMKGSNNLCTDNNRTVYVCNYQEGRIDILGFDLKCTGSFGKEELEYCPGDIKIYNNTIFVLTWGNITIHLFNTEHVCLSSIDLVGCGSPDLPYESYLAVDINGNIIVNTHDEYLNYCLKVFTPSGEWIESLGCGYLTRTQGIDVDRHNRIVSLSNSCFHCFQVY